MNSGDKRDSNQSRNHGSIGVCREFVSMNQRYLFFFHKPAEVPDPSPIEHAVDLEYVGFEILCTTLVHKPAWVVQANYRTKPFAVQRTGQTAHKHFRTARYAYA